MVSVQRDTYLKVGEDKYRKCNYAYAHGGVEEAIEHQLGRAAGYSNFEGGLAGALAGRFEVDELGIGGPGDRGVRSLVVGQLNGLSASDRDDIDIAVALDVRAECQPFAVRGDERGVLDAGHGDDGSRLAACGRDGEDIPVITEIDLLAVGGKRGMGGEADVVGGCGCAKGGG